MDNRDLLITSISYAVIIIVTIFLLKVAFWFFLSIIPVTLIVFILLKITQRNKR